MIIDPVQAFALQGSPTEALAASSVLPDKSSKSSPSTTILPSEEYQVAGENGKRTLWVVFVVMLIATVAFSAMAWSVPASKRLYHVITTLIVMTAAISYFAMASGDGISFHEIVIHHNGTLTHTDEYIYRQVYWARYVDWSLTTPLLLLDLCLVAGLNGCNITLAIVADLVMILTGLFAAFGTEGTPQKWGWYAIACIAYIVVVWHLAIHGRSMAMAKGGKVGGFFVSIAGFTFLLWTAYPIVWGIADGSRNVDVDGEIIAYAILDVLAKPVFGLWLLLTHMNTPETNIELGGFWAHGLSGEGAIRIEDDEGA